MTGESLVDFAKVPMLYTSTMQATEHMDQRQKTFMQGLDLTHIRERSQRMHEDLRKAKRFDQCHKRRYQPCVSESALDDIPTILRHSKGSSDSDLLLAAMGLRKLLANHANPPIQEVIDHGFVPALLTWMQRIDFPKLQVEACWAVTNIASGSHDHALSLVSKGVVPILHSLLQSKTAEVRDNAIWLIGNLAGDSPQIRDELLHAECLDWVLDCIQHNGTDTDCCPWAVANLCRGRPKPEFHLVAKAVPYLCSVLLTLDSREELSSVLWAISHLCAEKNDRVQMILDHNLLPKIRTIVETADFSVQFPALRIVGNIASGREDQTEHVICLVPFLRSLLHSSNLSIQKETAWICSNIASGSLSQVQSLLNEGILKAFIDLLPGAAEEIQREMLFGLGNASLMNNPEIQLYLCENGVFPALVHTLKHGSPSLIYAALDVIKALLCTESECEHAKFTIAFEACGGLEELEGLQFHGNPQVYEKALRLLEKHFETEGEADGFLRDLLVVTET